jgi:hypothetical protein
MPACQGGRWYFVSCSTSVQAIPFFEPVGSVSLTKPTPATSQSVVVVTEGGEGVPLRPAGGSVPAYVVK